MDEKHIIITKMFEEGVNSLLKGREKNTSKIKEQLCLVGQFLKHYVKKSFKKEDVTQFFLKKTWYF